MMQAHSICCLFGASLSGTKEDLQLKLMRLSINCNLGDDYHSQMLYAKNMGRILPLWSAGPYANIECAWIEKKANGARIDLHHSWRH